MTFSDGLPIQFWLTGCDTFNEKEVGGINSVCWPQPWNCSDEIPVQFLADSGTYTLSVKDSAGTELVSIDLEEVSDGVFAAIFVPEDHDICSETVRLVVIDSSDVAVAKTDILDIQSTHTDTELIEYSNNRNFAGLIYENVSPEQTFKIRVPCRFFHEEFPEEDEAMELTSSVITTMAQVKTQRKLEVQHVPYYFHRKLMLVLKHQTLTISGKEYQKEEGYNVNEGNPRWPLKSATCLLTEKNSVRRNVL